MTSKRYKPTVGDVIDVKPVRVSTGSKLIGHNYSNSGPDIVTVKKENLEEILSKEVRESLSSSAPFQIREVSEPYPAEIIKVDNGSLTVKYLPQSERSPSENSESLFPHPDREESVDGEWNGTPQEIDDEKTKRRSEVFKEDDLRGSKNDLL